MKNKGIFVDRNEFIAWTQGILLNMRCGVGIVVNEPVCQNAENALNRGETISLTETSNLGETIVLTAMKKTKKGYIERKA